MQHIDAAQAEGLDDDAPVAHDREHFEDPRVQTRGQLQQEDGIRDIGHQLGKAHLGLEARLVQHKAQIADLGRIVGIDALEGGEARGPDLHRPAAQHDLPVKGQIHAVAARCSHGEGGPQIVGAVGKHVRQGKLAARQHHGPVQARQHPGQGRGGVGHGIGAVGDDDAVVVQPRLEDPAGDLLPLHGPDVGGVQTHQILHGDVKIAAQLVQLPLHHITAVGLQPLTTRQGCDGAAGRKQENMFFVHDNLP